MHETTRLQRAVRMEAAPKEKWTRILVRTLTGTAIVTLGAAGGWKLGWNQWLTVGTVAVGAHMVSGQILTGSIKAVLGTVRDLVGILRKPDA